MRMNITTYRPHDALSGRLNGNTNSRLNKIYQAAAARMFYIWGEVSCLIFSEYILLLIKALSSQLEIILDTEQQQNSSTNQWNSDETFEDYYNEGKKTSHTCVYNHRKTIFILAIVNRSDHDCPYSLQFIVCLLLYEITSFLRETYETLPKLSSLSTPTISGVHIHHQQRTDNSQTVIDNSSILPDKCSPDRLRMNSVVSQVSNRSTVSLSSEQPPPRMNLYFK
jgi:hypothetical protein